MKDKPEKSHLKVLCYLQSEKVYVAVPQNQYMFTKIYHLQRIAGRANILYKHLMHIFFQFWTWLLRFLFYVISRSSSITCSKSPKEKLEQGVKYGQS